MVRSRRKPTSFIDALPEDAVVPLLPFLSIDDLRRFICTCKASRYRRNFAYLAHIHLVRRMVETPVLHKFYLLDGSGRSFLSRVKKTRFAARRVVRFGIPCCHHIHYGDPRTPIESASVHTHAHTEMRRHCRAHMEYH